GREHEVTRESRLDGNLRRLGVPDLADHDLVRIVPENRAQTAGEGQPLLFVDRDLGDAPELVLDRILDGNDLVLDGLDLRQRRVEGRRLSGAGRTSDEHHAIRLPNVLPEPSQLLLGKAENVQL